MAVTACATSTGSSDTAPQNAAPTTTVAATTATTVAATTATTTPPTTTTTTSTTTTTTSTTSTTSTTTTSTTTTTTTTVPVPDPIPAPPAADPEFTATLEAFDRLAAPNRGASISIARGGELVVRRGVGPTVVGFFSDSFTPMIVASVSKLMTALAVARLADDGLIELDAPMPWVDIGVATHPAWADVTVRQLLDHSAGMPVVRTEWFRGGATCREFLPTIVDRPPTGDRGQWRYSNGNYCALGLLLEHVTGLDAVDAVNLTVFEPLDLAGAHSTDAGLLPDDMVHPNRTERLLRLGAAGTFVVSSDDLALAFSRLSPADLEVLRQPAVFTDQYGFGHTGTIDGAKACTWILQDGATVLSAAISGDSVSTGGAVCDRLLPALATDLGLAVATRPDRWP